MQDHFETLMFEEMNWLSPVESVDVLQVTGVPENSLCYVQGENAVYQFVEGVWVKQSSKGSPEPGTPG